MPKGLFTILLLIASNTFMTIAWYGHLKFKHVGMLAAILISWGIALLEYSLMVPANKIGSNINGGPFNMFQLKIIQEVITLLVFCVFAVWVLKEPFQLKYLISFVFLIGAVYFMFK